ncbi:hypothetical protein BGZ83_010128 [Gryganskiella cystojenkinii]|nr:hypothetical protein BGZ83_010128 [Gryganskiella cystojenkinii]
MTTATSPIVNLGELARERSASSASKQQLEYQDRAEPRTAMAVDYTSSSNGNDPRHPPPQTQHSYSEEHSNNGYSEEYYNNNQQQQQYNGGGYSHHASSPPPPSTSSAHYSNGSGSYHQQQPPAIQTLLMNGSNGNGNGNGVHPHNPPFASPTSPALSPSPLSPSNVHPYQQQQHDYDHAQGYHPHHAHHASYPQDQHPHPLSPTADGNGHHFYPYPVPGNSASGHDNHHNNASNNGSYSSSASSTHYPRNHSFSNHHGSIDEHEPESPGGFGPGMGMGPDGVPLSNSHGGYSSSAPSSSVQRAKRRSEVFATNESPFFYPAQQNYTLLSMDQSTSYSLKIAAKIDRGFFLASNDWTCYRRNYFQLSASFSIQGLDSSIQPELPCLLDRGGELVRVHRFSICIGAQIQNGEKTIELVQHTPKRDKGPQITPRPTPVSPGGDLNSNSSEMNPNVITFERVQFKTATANNGKRRAAQQYYQVHVDLYADTDMGESVLVATSISAPLVVRGRSPGHYVDSEETCPATSPSTPGPQRQQPLDGRYSGYRNDSISSVVSGEYPYYSGYPYGSSYQYPSLASSASHMAAQQSHEGGAGYYNRQDEDSYPTSPLSPTAGPHSGSHAGMETPQHPLHGHPYMTPLVQHGFSPESVSPDTYSPSGFIPSGAESPSAGFNREAHAQGHGGQGGDQYGYPLSSYQQYQQQHGHHHQPQSPYGGQYSGHHHDHRDSHDQQDHETQLAGLRIHSPVSPGNGHSGSSSAGPSTPRRQSFSSSLPMRKNDHRGSIGGAPSGGAVSTRKARSISMSGISKRPQSKTRPSRTVPATPTRESSNNNMGGSLSSGGINNNVNNNNSSSMKGLGITKDRIPESPMEEQMAAKLSLDGGSSVYPFEDVTTLLDTATKGLKVGQLVQVPTFSLFDAMCAIVIMDPKMDTGMILDDDETPSLYNVNRLIDPKEFIWIFDNILIGEMTWLSGHALSQTLLTSCYVLRLMEVELEAEMEKESLHPSLHKDPKSNPPPPQFSGLVLKSCVLAIVKSCALIWTEMRKAQVYEEEDFMTNKFGASFYDNFPAAALISMLDRAEVWMEDMGTRWIHAYYEDDEAASVVAGVMSRLNFSRLSFMAFFQVVAPKCTMFPQALNPLKAMKDQVPTLRSTGELGIKVEGAFDHTIHRKLATNTPPRAIALLTLTETFDQLEEMCKDLVFIGQALPFPDSTNLVNFFIQFGRKKPAPGAFARSIVQTVLYDERIIMGTRAVHHVVRDHIQEIMNPPSWIFDNFEFFQAKLDAAGPTSTPTPASVASGLDSIPELAEDDDEHSDLAPLKRQIQAQLVMFVEKATKPFVDTLQIAGQNTSRQRRNLRKIVLLWETLQAEAEVFDEEVHLVMDEIHRLELGNENPDDEGDRQERMKRYYFVSWTYQMKLWVMEWMLMLGSELELYALFEYPMIYCILESHAQHARRIRYVLGADAQEDKERQEIIARALKRKLKNKKKKKKKKTSTALDAADPEDEQEGEGEGDANEEESISAATTSLASTTSKSLRTNSDVQEVASSIAALSTSSSPHSLKPSIEVVEILTLIRLNLTRGVSHILSALIKVGHLTLQPPHVKSHGLNDLRTLFDHRFKAFRELASPEILTFEGFENRSRCDGFDASDLLIHALERFNEASTLLDQLQGLSASDARVELCEEEWRKDIKSMLKLCIASKISVASLQKDGRILELRAFALEDQRRIAAIALQNAVAAKSKNKKAVFSTPKDKLLEQKLKQEIPRSGISSYKAPARRTQLEWKYHPWWPVISLSP